jgi:hypothetical protein
MDTAVERPSTHRLLSTDGSLPSPILFAENICRSTWMPEQSNDTGQTDSLYENGTSLINYWR